MLDGGRSAAGRCFFGLAGKRAILLPTWRGWLLIGAVTAVLLFGFLKAAHPFLAVNNGMPGGLMVVEGWATDPAIEAAVKEYRRGPYRAVFVTGGPIEAGSALALRPTFAELGADRLLFLGLETNVVHAVPAPRVDRDRTYLAALSLRRWLETNNIGPEPVHLISEGAHGRRSRLLYQRALGKAWPVTVTSMPPMGYDPKLWWTTSAGVKTVITEFISYAYTILFFSP